VVPGLIEGLIRLYDTLRNTEAEQGLNREGINARIAQQYLTDTRAKARLTSRLFWAHAIATGANAGRVAIQGGMTGDFFSAARAINLMQWQVFAVQTIRYAHARYRDTGVDQVVENRKRLDAGWDELKLNVGSVGVLYFPTQVYRPALLEALPPPLSRYA
jgi:hypothetical protein